MPFADRGYDHDKYRDHGKCRRLVRELRIRREFGVDIPRSLPRTGLRTHPLATTRLITLGALTQQQLSGHKDFQPRENSIPGIG
jgi:hypothetical protein